FTAGPVGALFGLLLVRQVLRLSPKGRQVWTEGVYALPVVGTLIRSARLAAFADLLAVLVEYEIPLPEAFRLAGRASADPLTAARCDEIHD
ncbi:hypothetical protein NL449_27515, partial [Klebsiella pneumoniae]|nr:hypothetical protein [Klebsiella pneumoniae]